VKNESRVALLLLLFRWCVEVIQVTGYVEEEEEEEEERCKEEKVDVKDKTKGWGRIYAQRGERRSRASQNNNASAGENGKNKQVSTRRSPSSSFIHRRSFRPHVCVCMCTFPFRQFINFADRGYHQEQEKKVDAISREASWYAVLAPALKTTPWIWVSDSQSTTAQIERSTIVCVICHRYPAAIGIGVCKQCAWVQALIVNKRLAMTS
jgi:hypothetical protein